MISYIKGEIIALGTSYLIVNTGNIGYRVYVSNQILSGIHLNEDVQFYTHQQLKEDSSDLYGFINLSELDFFEKLISISGIGPKTALGVMNGADVSTIQSAIMKGDPSLLTKVSGIGKKTAERIVLELKGKLGSIAVSTDIKLDNQDAELLDALEALGYSMHQAREVLKNISAEHKTLNEKVKAALQLLSR